MNQSLRVNKINLQNLKKTIAPLLNTLNLTLKPNTYISGRKKKEKKSSSQDCWPGAYLKAQPFRTICGNAGPTAVHTRRRRIESQQISDRYVNNNYSS
jgi:hypothetical protein